MNVDTIGGFVFIPKCVCKYSPILDVVLEATGPPIKLEFSSTVVQAFVDCTLLAIAVGISFKNDEITPKIYVASISKIIQNRERSLLTLVDFLSAEFTYHVVVYHIAYHDRKKRGWSNVEQTSTITESNSKRKKCKD